MLELKLCVPWKSGLQLIKATDMAVSDYTEQRSHVKQSKKVNYINKAFLTKSSKKLGHHRDGRKKIKMNSDRALIK